MKKRIFHITTIAIVILFEGLVLFNYQKRIYAFNISTSQESDGTEFTIMTYNIAAYDSLTFNENRQKELLSLIRDIRPDVLCFQEFTFDNLKKIQPQLDSIYGPCDSLKGDDQMYRSMFYSHFPIRTFSKYQCIDSIDTEGMNEEEVTYLEQLQRQMKVMSAEFEVEQGKWIKLFSCHLRSSAYSTARRSMDKDASWIDGISLYKRNYDVGKRIRDYVAENARRNVDDALQDGKPVVVAGDLNDWCGSDCLNTLMGEDLKDAWWEGGNGFGWTFSGWHLRLRLDHILYNDELELIDVKVIDSDLSDHKPLMARFRIKRDR